MLLRHPPVDAMKILKEVQLSSLAVARHSTKRRRAAAEWTSFFQHLIRWLKINYA